jgi:phi13 family phage major tail protein
MNANVGMVYPVYAPVASYTPGSSITYGTGGVVAEAVSASVTWNRNDGHFYGDDVELDSDNGITGYSISFEPSGLSDSVRAALLGDELANSEYSITDMAAPDVGFGYVRVMRTSGTNGVTYSYEAWWYHKIKFGIGSEETRTKEQSIEWRVPTLEGNGTGVSLDSSGKLKFAVHETFTSLSDAKSYLKTKAGIT